MGGSSSSTRSITIEEDQGTGMVKVSEAVAKRLLGHPESSADRRRKEKGSPVLSGDETEQQLQQLEYYQSRVADLETKNAELFNTTKDEFARTVEEVERKFAKTTGASICRDLQDEVLKCYQTYPKQTLLCSAQVKAFNQCVHQHREKILTRKG